VQYLSFSHFYGGNKKEKSSKKGAEWSWGELNLAIETGATVAKGKALLLNHQKVSLMREGKSMESRRTSKGKNLRTSKGLSIH